MSDNPYQAPAEEPPLVKPVKIWLREDFQAIVRHQKGVVGIMVVYLLFIAEPFITPTEGRLFSIFILVILGLLGTVNVYPLAAIFYSTRLAILFTVSTLIPGLGLIILLQATRKATNFLRSNGIKVGLLGANLSDV